MVWSGIPKKTVRPMPSDFPQVFIRVGWDEIEAELRAHKSTICRWILDYDAAGAKIGRLPLNQQRHLWLKEQYAARGLKVGGRRPVIASGRRF